MVLIMIYFICSNPSGKYQVLTQKIVHLALHGLNHIHTSYSYHISLTFDLHNCISTKNGSKHYYLLWFTLTFSKNGSKTLKNGQKTLKRVKNTKKGLKTLKMRKDNRTTGKYHGSKNSMGNHI